MLVGGLARQNFESSGHSQSILKAWHNTTLCKSYYVEGSQIVSQAASQFEHTSLLNIRNNNFLSDSNYYPKIVSTSSIIYINELGLLLGYEKYPHHTYIAYTHTYISVDMQINLICTLFIQPKFVGHQIKLQLI